MLTSLFFITIPIGHIDWIGFYTKYGFIKFRGPTETGGWYFKPAYASFIYTRFEYQNCHYLQAPIIAPINVSATTL